MRYVVTGAAGFIGSRLARALVERGHEVLGIDAYTDTYGRARKEENAEGLDVVEVDLAETPVAELLAGAAGIFHLAGQPGVRSSWGADFELYARRNLIATQRLLEQAVGTRARVVFSSSSSVYGDAERFPTREDAAPRPISPYGVTKLGCEHLLYAYGRAGLDGVILRYFTVYGPAQRPDMAFAALLEALAEGRPFRLFGDGGASRSFTYVGDAVEATIAAMELAPRGAVYNVGGGEEATMAEAIALAERIAGRPLEVERLPAAPGDARRTRADTARARRDLGWEPRTPLAEGLRAQWEWAVARVGSR
jgi:UDP-glucuronate 4-epimerase